LLLCNVEEVYTILARAMVYGVREIHLATTKPSTAWMSTVMAMRCDLLSLRMVK